MMSRDPSIGHLAPPSAKPVGTVPSSSSSELNGSISASTLPKTRAASMEGLAFAEPSMRDMLSPLRPSPTSSVRFWSKPPSTEPPQSRADADLTATLQGSYSLGFMLDSGSSKAPSPRFGDSEPDSELLVPTLQPFDKPHWQSGPSNNVDELDSQPVPRTDARAATLHRRPHDTDAGCSVTVVGHDHPKPPVKGKPPRSRLHSLRVYGAVILATIVCVTLIGLVIVRDMEAALSAPPVRPARAAASKSPPAAVDWHNLTNTPVWDASKWHGPPPIDPASPDWPGTIAICSIMKSEHPSDVEEWLRYHRWVGVDRVFLRENNNAISDRLRARLQPFVDSGFLQLDSLPGKKHPLQNRWYNRCSKPDMAGAHSWVAFVDLDEFLVVLEDGKAAEQPDLKKTLAAFKDHAGVSVQWVLFGSSGHVQRPAPGGPLRHYTRCTGVLSYQMKCLANTFWLSRETMMVGDTVHDCTYRMDPDSNLTDHGVVLTDGSPARMFENTAMTNPSRDAALGRTRSYVGHLNATLYEHHKAIRPETKLAIFHYVTRSLQEYVARKSKLPSGLYTHTFVTNHRRTHTPLMDLGAFAAFEKSFDFDQRHPVCLSVVEAKYAERCRHDPSSSSSPASLER